MAINARHHRVRNFAGRVCAAAFLYVAAGVVPAQTIHKQVDAAGRITYTDRPDTTPLPQTEAIPAPALDVTNALASNVAISSRQSALTDANEAARRLRQAQLEREQGAERLPSEQAHGTDASVVNPPYWRRQEELRRVVEQAQRRSSETGRLLRAHR